MIRKVPEDTKWFHFKNENPMGIRTTDCVIRGLAGALGDTWGNVYKQLFALAMHYSRPATDDFIVEKLLESKKAVRIAQPKKRDGTKFTAQEVCELIQEGKFIDNNGVVILYNSYYLNLGSGHAGCIVDGKVQDIWNSSYEKVGKMWGIV